jgi:hypothetical protein
VDGARGRVAVSKSRFASKVKNRTWIGSVQGAVATWSVIGMQNSHGFDQVATAPCTDPIQVRFLLLGQSHHRDLSYRMYLPRGRAPVIKLAGRDVLGLFRMTDIEIQPSFEFTPVAH